MCECLDSVRDSRCTEVFTERSQIYRSLGFLSLLGAWKASPPPEIREVFTSGVFLLVLELRYYYPFAFASLLHLDFILACDLEKPT